MIYEAFHDVIHIDRTVHEPSRFVILSVLAACRKADFKFLQMVAELSKSNLSLHLGKLEERRLITIEKVFIGKTARTWVRITPDGRYEMQEHRRRLTRCWDARKWWGTAGRILTSTGIE